MQRLKQNKGCARYKKRGKKLTLMLSLVLLLTFAVGGTVSYLVSRDFGKNHSFTPARVEIAVTEQNGAIQVSNEGTTDAYLRAAIVVNFEADNGDLSGTPPTEQDYQLTLASGQWYQDPETLFYYCTEPVAPGQAVVLVQSFSCLNAPLGYELSVEVAAEGIQAHGTTDSGDLPAYRDAWGIQSLGQ